MAKKKIVFLTDEEKIDLRNLSNLELKTAIVDNTVLIAEYKNQMEEDSELQEIKSTLAVCKDKVKKVKEDYDSLKAEWDESIGKSKAIIDFLIKEKKSRTDLEQKGVVKK